MTTHEPTAEGCTCGWENPVRNGEQPCKHGHFDCALFEGGPCANEEAARKFEQHLATIKLFGERK